MPDTNDPASPPQRPRRWRRRIAVYGLLYLVLAIMLTFGGCGDRLILFPTTEPMRYQGIERLEVKQQDGQPVEVWTARSAGAKHAEPRAFVLQFNGNASRAEPMAFFIAQEWGSRPVEVWAVNYPGYGGTPGPARVRAIPAAALAAYDELERVAQGRPIFVSGQSLGAVAALHVAANRPVAGAVLWSPPPLRDMILKRFGWWNLWLLAGPVSLTVPRELDSLRNAASASAPAVFVVTGQDTVVPLKYQTKVSDAYAGEKQFIRMPDSDHNSAMEGKAVQEYEAALDWLWERAVRAGGRSN